MPFAWMAPLSKPYRLLELTMILLSFPMRVIKMLRGFSSTYYGGQEKLTLQLLSPYQWKTAVLRGHATILELFLPVLAASVPPLDF